MYLTTMESLTKVLHKWTKIKFALKIEGNLGQKRAKIVQLEKLISQLTIELF